MSTAGASGQASVEVVGAAFILFVVGLVAFQLLAAGYAAVMADHAAEQAALALATGREPARAARDALPGWSERRVRVTRKGGRVVVELRPPALFDAVERRLVATSEAAVRTP